MFTEGGLQGGAANLSQEVQYLSEIAIGCTLLYPLPPRHTHPTPHYSSPSLSHFLPVNVIGPLFDLMIDRSVYTVAPPPTFSSHLTPPAGDLYTSYFQVILSATLSLAINCEQTIE